MNSEKTTLEVIAATVEEATAKGLAQLGLPASAVDIEVLDPGSRGLFGLGGRQARIRLVLKDITAPAIPATRKIHFPAKPRRLRPFRFRRKRQPRPRPRAWIRPQPNPPARW